MTPGIGLIVDAGVIFLPPGTKIIVSRINESGFDNLLAEKVRMSSIVAL